MKRLSFTTQFKIEFLLLFTGCRKVLGKIPECFHCYFFLAVFLFVMVNYSEKFYTNNLHPVRLVVEAESRFSSISSIFDNREIG